MLNHIGTIGSDIDSSELTSGSMLYGMGDQEAELDIVIDSSLSNDGGTFTLTFASINYNTGCAPGPCPCTDVTDPSCEIDAAADTITVTVHDNDGVGECYCRYRVRRKKLPLRESSITQKVLDLF